MRIAICARGTIINVVEADPNNTDLLDALAAATVIRGDSWHELADDDAVDRGCELVDGKFTNRLAVAQAEAVEAKARAEVMETKLTKEQLAEVDAAVAVEAKP